MYWVQYRDASCGNVQKCLWQGFWIDITLRWRSFSVDAVVSGKKWDNADETSLRGERLGRIFWSGRNRISLWSISAFPLSSFNSDETPLRGEMIDRVFRSGRNRISFWSKRAFSPSALKSFSAFVGFRPDTPQGRPQFLFP